MVVDVDVVVDEVDVDVLLDVELDVDVVAAMVVVVVLDADAVTTAAEVTDAPDESDEHAASPATSAAQLTNRNLTSAATIS